MSKLFISHRGNLSGPNPSRENQPSYIQETLDLGYNVEVDVWMIQDTFYLGHDKPEYIVDQSFFNNSNIWIHCKNLAALDELILEPDINCFANDKDDYVLTSKCYIWIQRKIKLTNNCIAVLPERIKDWDLKNCAGICSDHILSYERFFEEGKYE